MVGVTELVGVCVIDGVGVGDGDEHGLETRHGLCLQLPPHICVTAIEAPVVTVKLVIT